MSAAFIAIKWHRDADLGGAIGFRRALGLGLGISVVAGVFYVTAREAALALAHVDFAGSYANLLVEHLEHGGIDAHRATGFEDGAIASMPCRCPARGPIGPLGTRTTGP